MGLLPYCGSRPEDRLSVFPRSEDHPPLQDRSSRPSAPPHLGPSQGWGDGSHTHPHQRHAGVVDAVPQGSWLMPSSAKHALRALTCPLPSPLSGLQPFHFSAYHGLLCVVMLLVMVIGQAPLMRLHFISSTPKERVICCVAGSACYYANELPVSTRRKSARTSPAD